MVKEITVTENGFHFDNFIIRDTANNQLILNGLYRRQISSTILLDFDINATNFQVLQLNEEGQ